jgi:RNA polymerase sigma-70 factor (ECF subfamily)
LHPIFIKGYIHIATKVKTDLVQLWSKICLEGDTKAFEKLYYALFNKLIKFAIYYVNHRETAEDIVSEVFVKCWNNRKELGHVQYPESYLFIAVKNQSLQHLKKYSNVYMVEMEEHEYRLVDYSDPSKKIERKELHHQLDQAIEALPAQARMVFRLIKENGMKYKEVAEILDISPRTVQTQLFRAISKLRSALKPLSESVGRPNDDGKFLVILIVSAHLIKYFVRL